MPLKFKNEEARQQHPLARLIPKSLWANSFGSSLPESCIPLMQEDYRIIFGTAN